MATGIFIGPSQSSGLQGPHTLQEWDFRINGALSIYFGHLGSTQGVLSTAQPEKCPEIVLQQALNTTGHRKGNILSRDGEEGKGGLFKEALWRFDLF